MKQHPMPADMSIKERIWGGFMDTSQILLSGTGGLAAGVLGFGSYALLDNIFISVFLFAIVLSPPLFLAFYKPPKFPDMSLWVYLQRKRKNNKKSKQIINIRVSMADAKSLSHQEFTPPKEGLGALVGVRKREFEQMDKTAHVTEPDTISKLKQKSEDL